MAVDHIRYDLLTQDALRSVVRQVLTDAAKKGLPGDHHFYISFFTNADGVRISPRLREQYPEEITIILQHQYYDLVVREDQFEVGLTFNGITERLTVPFTAIKGFFDPSVQFGLQFETATDEEEEAKPADQTDANTLPDKLLAKESGSAESGAPGETKVVENDTEKAPGGAEVVRLDRFRKK